jgi:hypothetical protein
MEKASQCQTQAGKLCTKISSQLAAWYGYPIQRCAFDEGKQASQHLLGIQYDLSLILTSQVWINPLNRQRRIGVKNVQQRFVLKIGDVSVFRRVGEFQEIVRAISALQMKVQVALAGKLLGAGLQAKKFQCHGLGLLDRRMGRRATEDLINGR